MDKNDMRLDASLVFDAHRVRFRPNKKRAKHNSLSSYFGYH